MGKKLRCSQCNETKKARKVIECPACELLYCRKCTHIDGLCVPCCKIEQMQLMTRTVKKLIKQVEELKRISETPHLRDPMCRTT